MGGGPSAGAGAPNGSASDTANSNQGANDTPAESEQGVDGNPDESGMQSNGRANTGNAAGNAANNQQSQTNGASTAPSQNGPGSNGGNLLGGGSSEEITSLLKENADGYRWAAATTGSQNAAGYQLASELPVMAIGGFNGSDPAPTLDEFKSFVEEGLVRYYISSNGIGDGQMGGSDAASEIAEWVSANFEAQTIDGVTVYDLSAANASY